MHPLQNGSQTAEKPTANNPLGDPGYFTESGTDGRPSIPGADYFNAQIDEFKNVLLAGNVAFESSKFDHFQRAIAAQIAASMQDLNKQQLALRVGEVWESHHPSSVPGWIDLKGGVLSRITDKLLWDYANAADMVVNQALKDADPQIHAMKFGDGDGATSFSLPNHHLGHFVRGTPSSISHGDTQNDAIRNITGSFAVTVEGTSALSTSGASGVFEPLGPSNSVAKLPPSYAILDEYGVRFDVSRVVPVSNENRPYTANLSIKMHRGWM